MPNKPLKYLPTNPFFWLFIAICALSLPASAAKAEMFAHRTANFVVNQQNVPFKIRLKTVPDWVSANAEGDKSIAFGDMDNDGDLDLVIGGTPPKMYLNNGTTIQNEPSWSVDSSAKSIALGDIDNDGDLDLVSATDSDRAIEVYENVLGMLSAMPVWTFNNPGRVASLALGDIDGDADLDLAVGRYSLPTWVFQNEEGTFQISPAWTSSIPAETRSVAWGDMDGDGDIDLALGNYKDFSMVYENVGGELEYEPIWVSQFNDPHYTEDIAWGDMDNDGDLDLAIGNRGIKKVYLNNNGMLDATPGWVSNDEDPTISITWGDVDNDGDLDLAAGNIATQNTRNKIYLNENGMLQPDAVWIADDLGETQEIAFGDIDGDGDLDLAAANRTGLSKIYRNDLTIVQASQAWKSEYTASDAWSVAWGDVDNDGDLDLAVGNRGRNVLYRNDGNRLENYPSWLSTDEEDTRSVAWGDVDGDGDLDLAAGNMNGQSKLYINNNGSLQITPTILFDDTRTTRLAWGDVDGDGDLDLAAGGQNCRLYLNDGVAIQNTPVWVNRGSCDSGPAWGDVDLDGDLDLAVSGGRGELFLNENGSLQESRAWFSNDSTLMIAWGDVDGDGDLDLASGNNGPNKLYLNEKGALQSGPAWVSYDSNRTSAIAWADIDGDSDLDLIAHNEDSSTPGGIYVYANVNGVLSSSPETLLGSQCQQVSFCFNRIESLAVGDMDRDGDLDLALASEKTETVLYNSQFLQPLHSDQHLSMSLATHSVDGVTSPNLSANFYALTAIQGNVIPLTYWLHHSNREPAREIRAYYSLNGGGEWREAVPTADTSLADLATAPYPTRSAENQHIFYWDVNASGFYGQSDNVVVRFVALPSLNPTPNGVAGPFQKPYAATQSFPFRVRGNQVRVVNEIGNPTNNALIYRIPATQPDQSGLMGNAKGNFSTSTQGYLQGRGELKLGDRLFALQPISVTESYTLYQTSATPNPLGLNDFSVTSGGVQTLTVSTANPLLLFDLIVSLEWQEGTDTSFLNNLRRDLIESSKALYDWTNGQVALGKITVYQGRDHWDDAHIQMLASDQVRPSANRGGIVTDTAILTHTLLTEPITATRGIVRIGPNWTRYGDSDPNYVYDWQRVLAHELGHYLLFLEDTYLGLDEASGLLIPVDTCTNTAMSDPYEEVGTEFRYNDERWQTECGHTLAELPDWDLIRLAYPALHAPPPVNPGPGTMPFLFTTVEIKPPLVTATRLANPLLSLGNAASTLLNGRVYLRRPNQQLLDLGKYLGNELLVRGGHEGDELCIFATSAYACSYLSNSQPANFVPQPLWTPMIAVTPTSTTTLTIFVEQAAGAQVNATIYPDGATPQTVSVTTGSPQPITLNQPAVEALVEITGAVAGERFITGYAVGSGPGRLRSFDGPGRLRSFDGPVSSGDGGVVLYPPLATPKETFISLQLATTLPALPLGLVPVGRAYYVRPSTEIADYAGGSIAFQYLGRDVDQFHLPEENLAVYYWDGSQWVCFKCTEQVRNPAQNVISAPLKEAGLYMLAGFQLALHGPGINMVGYPLPYSLPVTKALTSLTGAYNVIYHYDTNNFNNPWSAFGADAPAWANTLIELKPNRGYWLYVNENLWWSITDQGTTAAAVPQQPPAIFYGLVLPTENVVPGVDMAVTATVDGKLCGQARTQLVDGQIVYVIAVLADELPTSATCGRAGQSITFAINGQTVPTVAQWDNARMQRVDLMLVQGSAPNPTNPKPGNSLYLPLITNQ
jgi:hypothetical protein